MSAVRAAPSGAARASGRRRSAPVAGIGYLLAWVAGLAVFSSSTQVRSSGADVLRADTGHQVAADVQYLLTEGLAGVLLAGVVLVLAGVTSGAVRRTLLGAGLAAAAVSVVQCGLGIWLAGRLVGRADADGAGAVFEALNRLDGVKMLLLAVFAVAVVIVARGATGVLPPWLGPAAVALAVAIAVSAAGYLLLNDRLAVAAWLSLPLLLVVVTGIGVTVRGPEPVRA